MGSEVPQNGGYLIAAYVIAPVILVGYLALLWKRQRGWERRTGNREQGTGNRETGNREQGTGGDAQGT